MIIDTRDASIFEACHRLCSIFGKTIIDIALSEKGLTDTEELESTLGELEKSTKGAQRLYSTYSRDVYESVEFQTRGIGKNVLDIIDVTKRSSHIFGSLSLRPVLKSNSRSQPTFEKKVSIYTNDAVIVSPLSSGPLLAYMAIEAKRKIDENIPLLLLAATTKSGNACLLEDTNDEMERHIYFLDNTIALGDTWCAVQSELVNQGRTLHDPIDHKPISI